MQLLATMLQVGDHGSGANSSSATTATNKGKGAQQQSATTVTEAKAGGGITSTSIATAAGAVALMKKTAEEWTSFLSTEIASKLVSLNGDCFQAGREDQQVPEPAVQRGFALHRAQPPVPRS
jgi:hypothetical protein